LFFNGYENIRIQLGCRKGVAAGSKMVQDIAKAKEPKVPCMSIWCSEQARTKVSDTLGYYSTNGKSSLLRDNKLNELLWQN
jgi:hypothetical protein